MEAPTAPPKPSPILIHSVAWFTLPAKENGANTLINLSLRMHNGSLETEEQKEKKRKKRKKLKCNTHTVLPASFVCLSVSDVSVSCVCACVCVCVYSNCQNRGF